MFFKKASVGIGKGFQVVFQILASLFLWSVQHFEKVAQCSPQILCLITSKVVVELIVSEHAGIFSIKAEHDADAKDVQPSQGFG